MTTADASLTCAEVFERLSPLLDGELGEGARPRVRAHLERCSPCARAFSRLERLEALSRRLLAPPAVSPAEWGARRSRVSAETEGARIVSLAARRERALSRSLTVFAVAAAALAAATLALPLLVSRPAHQGGEGGALALAAPGEGAGHDHLCVSQAPGANQAEIIEVDGDLVNYAIGVDYPSTGTDEPVVIMISKLY